MENVWKSITEENGKYFASSDKIFLDKIEDNLKSKLDLSIIPLHFIGDISKAKVLVLNLNPGINKKNLSFYKDNEEYQKKIINNLTFKDPKFFEFDYYTENNEGYWSRLSPLFSDKYSEKIAKNKISKDTKDLDIFFTKNIALVEFFPYHSKKYNNCYDMLGKSKEGKKDYLPSQKFVFELIKERLNNSADDVIIIISRSRSKWFEAIKELKNYSNCYILSNPQNPSFKKENIMKCQFNKGHEILEKIK